MLNASQAVVAAYRYDPFGTLLAKTGTFDQPFQFSTKRYDARIGMVQYEFRNYLPAIGRWLTRDPLGEAGGLNLYAFVGNNPVNWVDPWGESPIGCIIKLTKTGAKKVANIFTKKAAIKARKQGENVIMKNRTIAKAVEIAANGKAELLRHEGHELADGTVGNPHFQTNGKIGHSFWGDITVYSIIGALFDPFDSIMGEIATDEEAWAELGRNPDGSPMSNQCYPTNSCSAGR